MSDVDVDEAYIVEVVCEDVRMGFVVLCEVECCKHGH